MLTGVVLCPPAFNSLSRSLSSLNFCDRLLVISDGEASSDLLQLAGSLGASVVSRDLDGDFSAQRNFALSQVDPGWVFFLDVDEEVSSALAAEISAAVKSASNSGYLLSRRDFLWGHEFKYGDLKDFRVLRLARHDAGLWTGQVHETWRVNGQIGQLSSPLYHYPHPTLYEFLHRLNLYSSIRARELYEQKVYSNLWQIIFFPLGKFFYLYLGQFGLLDGLPGLIHALCMSFYTFLVRGKLLLLHRGIGEYA